MGSTTFSVPFCRPTFICCFSRGGELCVDSGISSYRNKNRIWEILNINLNSKQFLPCGWWKTKNIYNFYKTLTQIPWRRRLVAYNCRQDGVQDREFAANRALVLLKGRKSNTLPSTFVYEKLPPLSSLNISLTKRLVCSFLSDKVR